MTYGDSQSLGIKINVEDYAALVKRISLHMISRMPASVQLDDLVQAGMVGLLEAAQKFDGSRGAAFETYAGIRIRGSIVDEMRRGDWVPRSVHRNSRRIMEAVNTVEARMGADAQNSDVAEEMGVTIDEYHAMANDSLGGRLFSYEETISDEAGAFGENVSLHPSGASTNPFPEPAASVQKQKLQKSLAEAIGTLPEKERLVLSLYYNEELNLKEIGLVLGVSESRVSQIHSQAAIRLKKKLADWQSV